MTTPSKELIATLREYQAVLDGYLLSHPFREAADAIEQRDAEIVALKAKNERLNDHVGDIVTTLSKTLAAEREACAKIVVSNWSMQGIPEVNGYARGWNACRKLAYDEWHRIATAIRARKGDTNGA